MVEKADSLMLKGSGMATSFTFHVRMVLVSPNGGLRMVETGLEAYGYHLGAGLHEIWTKYRKDHYSGPTRLDRDVSLSA